jgi:cobalt-zinc-cadmium efflux system membrane fusion protein
MARNRLLLAAVALAAIAAAAALPVVRNSAASLPGLAWLKPAPTPDRGAAQTSPHDHDDDGIVKLTERQIETAGIAIAEVHDGALARRIVVPGTVVPSGDRIARVAVKLLGTVAELRKRLGEPVARDEVVAVVDSREVAVAKSEFLATKTTHDLQQILFARAKMLWEGKVATENDYLRARAVHEDARIKMEVSRQKLSALGLTAEQITTLPQEPAASLRLHELRSPIAGKVAERRVDLGALVGREGQENELYVIVDLDVLWADLAVPPADLPSLREGQQVTLISGATGARTQGKIIFISPLLDKDTRSARVVAAFDNPAHAWRPGAFITAEIPLDEQRADIVVPKAALQTVKGDRVAFVRRDDGFEARKVATGREDDRTVEIVSGLAPGERIAASNTFVLKAELGKAQADD